MYKSHSQLVTIGFFNPMILNSNGYFWHPNSHAYFQSRICPQFCFKILNPELQIREIPDPPKKLLGTSLTYD